MTPAAEKAKELVDKCAEYAYTPWHGGEDELPQEEAAKALAIICCNEILEMARIYDNHNVKTDKHIYTFECVIYWQSVKEEIQNA